jgi:hypothetical protein
LGVDLLHKRLVIAVQARDGGVGGDYKRKHC